MEERCVKLLEYEAIRFVTKMDYRVLRELESSGVLKDNPYPCLDDFRSIRKDFDTSLLSDKAVSKIDDVISNAGKVQQARDRYAEGLERYGIDIVCREDKEYPFTWKNLSGMPRLFFTKGDKSILSDITYKGAVSVVGSRTPGRYSLYATGQFSGDLSKKGVAVVSGLAFGIDRKAHEACLDAAGKTVAITAGGADVIYPFQNADIYDRICAEGVIVTELPPGQEVLKQYFPSRNRLISALGDACLIMEAGMYSGTLHTASFAGAQGKDVFVLPGSIYDKNALGGLLLLRDGAEVLIDVDTVYERIQTEIGNRLILLNEKPHNQPDTAYLRTLAKSDPEKLNEDEWKTVICDEISEKPRNIDELCISLGIPFTYLSSVVTMLETEGRIENDRGKYVLLDYK